MTPGFMSTLLQKIFDDDDDESKNVKYLEYFQNLHGLTLDDIITFIRVNENVLVNKSFASRLKRNIHKKRFEV